MLPNHSNSGDSAVRMAEKRHVILSWIAGKPPRSILNT